MRNSERYLSAQLYSLTHIVTGCTSMRIYGTPMERITLAVSVRVHRYLAHFPCRLAAAVPPFPIFRTSRFSISTQRSSGEGEGGRSLDYKSYRTRKSFDIYVTLLSPSGDKYYTINCLFHRAYVTF